MKPLRNLNYDKKNNRTNKHTIPNTLRLLGSVNYYDTPGIFTI